MDVWKLCGSIYYLLKTFQEGKNLLVKKQRNCLGISSELKHLFVCSNIWLFSLNEVSSIPNSGMTSEVKMVQAFIFVSFFNSGAKYSQQKNCP